MKNRQFLEKAAAAIEGKCALESRLAAIYSNALTQRLREVQKLGESLTEDQRSDCLVWKLLCTLS